MVWASGPARSEVEPSASSKLGEPQKASTKLALARLALQIPIERAAMMYQDMTLMASKTAKAEIRMGSPLLR